MSLNHILDGGSGPDLDLRCNIMTCDELRCSKLLPVYARFIGSTTDGNQTLVNSRGIDKVVRNSIGNYTIFLELEYPDTCLLNITTGWSDTTDLPMLNVIEAIRVDEETDLTEIDLSFYSVTKGENSTTALADPSDCHVIIYG